MRRDVLIVGAGPAGCVVARRLAATGVGVALVGGTARQGIEGLSARSIALLAEEGLGIDGAAAIAGPLARRGRWADRIVEGAEWLVERGELAAALGARARDAGAEIRRDIVTRADRIALGWRVHLHSGGTLEAAHLIDARGRRGSERRGPLLLAIGRQFRIDSARMVCADGTRIEATDNSWCWWAVRGSALWVQVVGRPRAAARGSTHPASWLATAAAEIPALAALLDAAAPQGKLLARAAHARLGVTETAPTRWRVGDAAFALDPLSGQGVYEAVRGARLVATALHSVLEGFDAELAQRFVRERQHAAWQAGVSQAAGFFREQSRRGGFWVQTAEAYERLLPAAPLLEPRIERRPVLAQGRIVEREVVVTAQHPRGVWHVAGVPLAPLQGYLESSPDTTLAAAAAALTRPPPAGPAAIRWLREAGMIAAPPGRRMSLGD